MPEWMILQVVVMTVVAYLIAVGQCQVMREAAHENHLYSLYGKNRKAEK
jgi:hypothetical protein